MVAQAIYFLEYEEYLIYFKINQEKTIDILILFNEK